MVPELDNLQYADEITQEERLHVQDLIRREILQTGNIQIMHPNVTRILPLEEREEEPVYGGIDLERYESEDNIYSTFTYAQLQERNLDMCVDNQAALHAIQEQYLEQVEQISQHMETNNTRKRARLHAVEEARKRKQAEEYGPKIDSLNERWKEGIEGVVDAASKRTI